MNVPVVDFMALVRRLSVLKDFPVYSEGQEELARTLIDISGGNGKFATEIVDSFCDDGGQSPDPRAIKLRAYQILHPERDKPLGDATCVHCRGTGFVSFTKLKRFGEDMIPRDYAAKCVCRGGQPVEVPPEGMDAAPAKRPPPRADIQALLDRLASKRKPEPEPPAVNAPRRSPEQAERKTADLAAKLEERRIIPDMIGRKLA